MVRYGRSGIAKYEPAAVVRGLFGTDDLPRTVSRRPQVYRINAASKHNAARRLHATHAPIAGLILCPQRSHTVSARRLSFIRHPISRRLASLGADSTRRLRVSAGHCAPADRRTAFPAAHGERRAALEREGHDFEIRTRAVRGVKQAIHSRSIALR